VEQREREDTGAPSPEIPRRTVSCQSHWPDRGRGGQRSRYRVYRPYIPQSGRDAARPARKNEQNRAVQRTGSIMSGIRDLRHPREGADVPTGRAAPAGQ
jgi:hypothetical protein